jgi:hypothetical protein
VTELTQCRKNVLWADSGVACQAAFPRLVHFANVCHLRTVAKSWERVSGFPLNSARVRQIYIKKCGTDFHENPTTQFSGRYCVTDGRTDGRTGSPRKAFVVLIRKEVPLMSHDGLSVNNELGRMWQDAVVALDPCLPGENVETHVRCRRIAGVWAEIKKYQVAAPLRPLPATSLC